MTGRAYVTGVGIVSPIGIGKQAFEEALRRGQSALGPLRQMDASGFRVGAGGEVVEASFDEDIRIEGRCLAFARRACREAIEDAGLMEDLPVDTPLAVGSGAGEMRAMERSMGPPESSLLYDLADPVQPPNVVTTKLAHDLGLRGRLLTFINACAAGAQAIAVAGDLVRSGKAEVALAGGVESLNRMVMAGFEALRAISPTGCHPFDTDRDGIQLGELAAFVVLESGDRVQARGVAPYAELSGSGASDDAFYVVRPDEE